jgi:D-amino peptidase
MKVYISADIEGVTGVTHWDAADRLKSEYIEFREQMTSDDYFEVLRLFAFVL